MSKQAESIESARRAYAATLGTSLEAEMRRIFEREIQKAKAK
jgi:plasmid stability protein